jgi:hypothetical protein
LIFVSQAKLPVPLFSYRLFEVKSLDCFSTVLLGGQLVYYQDLQRAIQFRPFAVDLRRSLY